MVRILAVTAAAMALSLGLGYAHAQGDSIPEWVRDVAGFWAEGMITDSEFVEAVEFLIDEDIIRVSNSHYGLAGFVDPDEDPRHYIDRYNNEPAYKEWFDMHYSDLTIYEAVGISSPTARMFYDENTELRAELKEARKLLNPPVTSSRISGLGMSIEEVKASALRDLDYDPLLRNNEAYVNSIVYYKGTVTQVFHNYDDLYGLNFIPEGENSGSIVVAYEGPRLLNGDKIEIYGVVEGIQDLKTLSGQEIQLPSLRSLYLELLKP